MPIVTMPDGLRVNFPDDMPKEEIKRKIATKYPDFVKDIEKPATKVTGASKAVAKLTGVAQGVWDLPKGAGQLALRGAEAITNLPGENIIGSSVSQARKDYENMLRGQEEFYRGKIEKYTGEEPSDFDAYRLAGNVVNPLNYVIPGGTTYGQIAKAGAITSALQPVETTEDTTQGEYFLNKAGQGAIGAVTAPVAAAAMRGIGNIFTGRTPQAAEKLLMEEGVGLTPGQMLGAGGQKIESTLESLPVAGQVISSTKMKSIEQFNRAVYNRVLKPLGMEYDKSLPVGREGVDNVYKTLSSKYKEIIPKISLKLDRKFVNDVSILSKSISKDELLLPEQKQIFTSIINNKILPRFKGENMSGSSFQAIRQEILDISTALGSSEKMADRQLTRYLDRLGKSFLKTAERSTKGPAAKDLKILNQSYSKFLRMQRAATSTANEGVFTPAAYTQALKAMDFSRGKGAFAKGLLPEQDLAEAARKVLGEKLPNSGTADRLLMATLMSAGLSGGASLAGHPEYAALGAIPLMYTPAGQKAILNALTKRPAPVRTIGELMRAAAPAAGRAAATTAGTRF